MGCKLMDFGFKYSLAYHSQKIKLTLRGSEAYEIGSFFCLRMSDSFTDLMTPSLSFPITTVSVTAAISPASYIMH